MVEIVPESVEAVMAVEELHQYAHHQQRDDDDQGVVIFQPLRYLPVEEADGSSLRTAQGTVVTCQDMEWTGKHLMKV